MNNKGKIIFVITVMILFSISIIGFAADKVPVKTARVKKSEINLTERITGRFAPYKVVAIPAETSGIVTELNVEMGDYVNKDDILLKLEQDKLKVELQEAEASLKSAKANLEQLQNGATEEQISQAQASYEQARASLQKARDNLKYTKTIVTDKRNLKQALNNAETQLETAKKQLETTNESYNQARINLEKAKNDYQRLQSLYNDQAATKEQYDNAKTALENAKSNLNAAAVNREKARVNLQGARKNYNITLENYQKPTELEQQLQTARSQVEIAKANLQVARSNLEDLKNGTRPEKIEVGEASVQQAESALKLKKLELEDKVLHSPLSGVVSSVNIEEGEMVNKGVSVINIIKTKNLYAEAYVTANLVTHIQKEEKVKIKPKVFPEFTEGVIEKISPEMDSQKQAYLVKVRVKNEQEQFKPGMFVDVYFITAEAKNTITVPLKAVLDIDTNPHVYKVVNNRAVRVNIKPGIVNKTRIEVLRGLSENDEIIISGQNSIVDGDMVEVVN